MFCLMRLSTTWLGVGLDLYALGPTLCICQHVIHTPSWLNGYTGTDFSPCYGWRFRNSLSSQNRNKK